LQRADEDRERTGAAGLPAFAMAGRALFSLGLVKGTEGNLSTFDGATLSITRTGAPLDDLSEGDLVTGPLDGELAGASSDLEVHRRMYAEQGPGAVAHAHPPGTVPEGGGGPGAHGAYAHGATLEEAVGRVVDDARRGARSGTPAGGSAPS
jgi:hypothetical protein